jgi:hypothetical protein
MKALLRTVLVVAVGIFSLVAVAVAASPIEVTIDFSEGTYVDHATTDGKSVIIDSITVDRAQPAAAGAEVDISAEYVDTQIGWIDYRGAGYAVVLKNKDVEQFVREAITLAFDRSGYSVISTATANENTIHVDVTVSELWMWAIPMEGNKRQSFYFSMDTELTSNTDGIADIGSVHVTDYRNGSRVTHWKSYRNTIMHSMKAYIASFADQLKQMEAGAPSATSSLAEKLNKLDELREEGVISDEEFAAARLRVIEANL